MCVMTFCQNPYKILIMLTIMNELNDIYSFLSFTLKYEQDNFT